MVSEAIAAGDVQAINYFVAQKYVEALTAFAHSPNQKTFLMPMETSGILGALGGIAEIARQTFGGERRRRRRRGARPSVPVAGSPRRAVVHGAAAGEFTMILDVITTLGGWSWWVLGLVLLGIEVLLPGFFFLWFGIAAILIGISALLIDWPWQLQVVGFVVLSVIVGADRPPLRRQRRTATPPIRISTFAPAGSRARPSSSPSRSWKAAAACRSMTRSGRCAAPTRRPARASRSPAPTARC